MTSDFLKPRNLAFSFSEILSEGGEFEKYDLNSLWQVYWNKNGEEIVLDTWNRLYKDYIVSEEESKEVYFEEKEDLQPEEYSEEWETLWYNHWCEQQNYVFSLFENNYYADFNPNYVKLTLEKEFIKKLGLPSSFTGRDVKEEESNIEKLDKQLKKLGLPTSFKTNNSRGIFSEEESETDEEEMDLSINIGKIKKRNRKNKKKFITQNLPQELQKDPELFRYWKKRFSLFSKFDEGIQLDKESWYSVTPENVAKQLANRIKCDIIVDAFCGCGGNSIQFAQSGKRVIAIDIDEGKILKAKNNAKIYKVEDKIEFIVADFFKICENLKAEAIFLSPPWGGVDYKKCLEYDIETQLQPVGATVLFEKCRAITTNIAIFLPRNSNTHQIIKLAGPGNKVEVEKNFLDKRFVGMTAFYGGLIKDS